MTPLDFKPTLNSSFLRPRTRCWRLARWRRITSARGLRTSHGPGRGFCRLMQTRERRRSPNSTIARCPGTPPQIGTTLPSCRRCAHVTVCACLMLAGDLDWTDKLPVSNGVWYRVTSPGNCAFFFEEQRWSVQNINAAACVSRHATVHSKPRCLLAAGSAELDSQRC